jgi:hypothetical protein
MRWRAVEEWDSRTRVYFLWCPPSPSSTTTTTSPSAMPLCPHAVLAYHFGFALSHQPHCRAECSCTSQASFNTIPNIRLTLRLGDLRSKSSSCLAWQFGFLDPPNAPLNQSPRGLPSNLFAVLQIRTTGVRSILGRSTNGQTHSRLATRHTPLSDFCYSPRSRNARTLVDARCSVSVDGDRRATFWLIFDVWSCASSV